MVYDLTPLEQIVGPLPYTMEDGVKITVNWLRAQGELSPVASYGPAARERAQPSSR
jgi:hypothetical protein